MRGRERRLRKIRNHVRSVRCPLKRMVVVIICIVRGARRIGVGVLRRDMSRRGIPQGQEETFDGHLRI